MPINFPFLESAGGLFLRFKTTHVAILYSENTFFLSILTFSNAFMMLTIYEIQQPRLTSSASYPQL